MFCVDGKDAFKEQHQGSEMVIWSEMGNEVEGGFGNQIALLVAPRL